VLAAQRSERARVRSERHQRWGRPHSPRKKANLTTNLVNVSLALSLGLRVI
jgi:hypothetical protein